VFPKLYPGFGYPAKAFVPRTPVTQLSPVAPSFGVFDPALTQVSVPAPTPIAPIATVAPASPFDPFSGPGLGKFVPSTFNPIPTVLPLPTAANAAETSFFATYPQKSILPFSLSQLPEFVRSRLPSVFAKFLNPGILQRTPFNPIFQVAPPTVATPIPQGIDPWKPVGVSPQSPLIPSPTTNTILKPPIKLLPPFGSNSNNQPSSVYLPAPSSSASPVDEETYNEINEERFQHGKFESNAIWLLEIFFNFVVISALQQVREEAHAAQVAQYTSQQQSVPFNGQPYDPPSNNGRYIGPSSYEVDINQGYQK
jgi:hypothetical protein